MNFGPVHQFGLWYLVNISKLWHDSGETFLCPGTGERQESHLAGHTRPVSWGLEPGQLTRAHSRSDCLIGRAFNSLNKHKDNYSWTGIKSRRDSGREWASETQVLCLDTRVRAGSEESFMTDCKHWDGRRWTASGRSSPQTQLSTTTIIMTR